MKQRLLTSCLLLLACFSALTRTVHAQTAKPLAQLAFLAGGIWIGEGKWPNGTVLRVEVRYFWGPTKRVLHFVTHDLASGQRTLLYEGILFFDRKRGKLMQYNFKPSGDLDESELSDVTDKGYTVRGANTQSSVQQLSQNEFEWKLRVQQAGEWKEILRAKYQRRT